jgi:microcystin-dependent protein
MSEPFVGEIRMFGGNFAPVGWMFCQGQLLAISEFDTLFNLIGTTYGGDGQSTFGLPDLRGRFPLHQGNGFVMGENAGAETATLLTTQIPLHTHAALCGSGGGTSQTPVGKYWSTDPAGNTAAYTNAGGAKMAASAIGNAGGSLPHNNVQPFLVVSFIISLFGVFPSQN